MQSTIRIDPSALSPYDFPRLVEAQDPAAGLGDLDLSGLEDIADDTASDDTAAVDPGIGEATPETTPEGPSEAEMVKEIEESPAASWEKYLQPILKDIRNTVKVPIELQNSHMVPFAQDPDLGFYITGVVAFLDEVPAVYADLPKGERLRYVAYVSPDGILTRDIDLIYSTQQKAPTPDYRPSNPNTYR